jgi:hypothetical protein
VEGEIGRHVALAGDVTNGWKPGLKTLESYLYAGKEY